MTNVKVNSILKPRLTLCAKLFIAIILISFLFDVVKVVKYLFPVLEIKNRKSNNKKGDVDGVYIISTEGCKIAKTPIRTLKPNTRKIPNCSYVERMSTLDDDLQILSLSKKYKYSKCCLQVIQREEMNDNKYKLSNCTTMAEDEDVKDHEMFITICRNNSMNFEANFKLNPTVIKKLHSWKLKSKIQKPISVMLIGIDSISRSLAYGALPKTLEHLMKMGFIDFKGYHSAGVGTVFNYFAFLTGTKFDDVRNTCAPNWESPFDSCRFIWKNFSNSNYVTMYVEDGHQTFNWGGQSGFQHKPSDYYVHALFAAMENLRVEYSTKMLKLEKSNDNLEKYAYCASNESSTEFSIRYTKRFITKFSQVPTFSFTFFANPFHDYGEGILPNYDETFLEFFQFINSSTKMLNDTIIIFLSDHGLRERLNLEQFLEMGLPMFFIRLPDKLIERYPQANIKENLFKNSEKLTSPYDMHQTFLHILALSEENTTFPTKYFDSNLLSPSSLLVPVSDHRTCSDIHVAQANCVCNLLADFEPVKNTFLFQNMKSFAMDKLNHRVRTSKYSSVCEKLKWNDSITCNVIARTSNYTENLFQFKVNPKDAHFEARIRVFNRGDKFGECELLGTFLRINTYGNQSWCVASVTDLDKEMKGLCICK